jgi:hypothetical protein
MDESIKSTETLSITLSGTINGVLDENIKCGATNIILQNTQTVVLSAHPSGGTGKYNYNWTLLDNIQPVSTTQIYTINPGDLTTGLYLYKLIVTDSFGTQSVPCSIIIIMKSHIMVNFIASKNMLPLTIYHKGIYDALTTDKFSITADGKSDNNDFSYLWTLNGNFHSSLDTITPSMPTEGTYKYNVILTDSNGIMSVPYLITFNVKKPMIIAITGLLNGIETPSIQCTKTVTVTVPASLVLTASASGGAPPYIFQWYQNGSPTPIVIGPVLSFTELLAGTDVFMVTATDRHGVVSPPCIITFIAQEPPTLSVTVIGTVNGKINSNLVCDNGSLAVNAGDRISLTATATGGSDFIYQWMLNGVVVSNGQTYAFVVPRDTAAQVYTVTATTLHGLIVTCDVTVTAVSTITITIFVKINHCIVKKINDCETSTVNIPVHVGDFIELSAYAVGGAIPSSGIIDFFQYEWFFGGNLISTSEFVTPKIFAPGSYTYEIIASPNSALFGLKVAACTCVAPKSGTPPVNCFITLTATNPCPLRSVINYEKCTPCVIECCSSQTCCDTVKTTCNTVTSSDITKRILECSDGVSLDLKIDTATVNAVALGGIPPHRYTWILPDRSTLFTPCIKLLSYGKYSIQITDSGNPRRTHTCPIYVFEKKTPCIEPCNIVTISVDGKVVTESICVCADFINIDGAICIKSSCTSPCIKYVLCANGSPICSGTIPVVNSEGKINTTGYKICLRETVLNLSFVDLNNRPLGDTVVRVFKNRMRCC